MANRRFALERLSTAHMRYTTTTTTTATTTRITTSTTAGRTKRIRKELQLGLSNIKTSLDIEKETKYIYEKLEKVNKHKFIKSILFQKQSSIVLEKLKKIKINEKIEATNNDGTYTATTTTTATTTDIVKNRVAEKEKEKGKEEARFSTLIKKSLMLNPLNITAYFNLICFYENRNDFPNVYFFSSILHNLLKQILSKYFYKGKYYNKKRNHLRSLESLIYRKKESDKYKIRIIRKIRKYWKHISCKNDELLVLLLYENLNFLCLSSYQCGFMERLIHYADLFRILLTNQLLTNENKNRDRNKQTGIHYLKGELFFLSITLYYAKALCFVLTNEVNRMVEIKDINKKKVEIAETIETSKTIETIETIERVKNRKLMGTAEITKKENKKQNLRSIRIRILDKEEITNILDRYKEVVKEKSVNKNDCQNDYQNDCQNICTSNMLSYEQKFLSHILNEKEMLNEIKMMNHMNCFEKSFISLNIQSLLLQLGNCIDFCLYNRFYKLLEECLIWRARIFFHFRYFQLCLSDTSKVLLLNIFSEANINIINVKEVQYKCYLLRIISLKELNLLNSFELCLAYMLLEAKNNLQELPNDYNYEQNCDNNYNTNYEYDYDYDQLSEYKKQEMTQNKTHINPKMDCINVRSHAYPWGRPYEDQYLLNILSYNKHKIPFTL